MRTKKERNSSGRSSTGSRRETAESLFDQLTVVEQTEPTSVSGTKPSATPVTAPGIQPKIKTEPRDYSAFAEGIKDMNLGNTSSNIVAANVSSKTDEIIGEKQPSSIKIEMIGPLDKQLEEESAKSREQSELDKSIASITEDVKTVIKTEITDNQTADADVEMKTVNPSSVNPSVIQTSVIQSPSPTKRSVISQEETDQAVTALLGESFENSFEEKQIAQNQSLPVVPSATSGLTSQQQSVNSVTSASGDAPGIEPEPMQMDTDEAAKAAAGLESEMATENSASLEQPQQPLKPSEAPVVPALVPSLPVSETSKEKPVTTFEPVTVKIPEATTAAPPPAAAAALPTRGRGSRGGRGGRAAAGSRNKPEVQTAEPLPVVRRASSRGRSTTGSESETDKPPEVPLPDVRSVRGRGAGSRGGRGGRAAAALAIDTAPKTLPTSKLALESNASSTRRRSSETSTDSNKTGPLALKTSVAAAPAATKISVFDWPDMDDESEMMASPTLKEEKAKRGQQLQQLQVDTGKLEAPGVQPKSSPLPKVVPEAKPIVATPPIVVPVTSGLTTRQRRGTGSSRGSKDQLETPASAATASTASAVSTTVASNNDLEVKQETEEKINAILEHAKKQQEIEKHQHNQHMGLLREVAQQQQVHQHQGHQGQQQQPSQAQPALSVFPANPAQMMTALQQAAAAGQTGGPQAQQTPRPPPAVTVTVQQSQQPQQPQQQQIRQPPTHQQTPTGPPQIVQPPLANSPGLSVVQLPTQPLPASEIARNVSHVNQAKQVLLEPKASTSPRPRTLSSSPRTGSNPGAQMTPGSMGAGSISLPTQPVPLSATQLTSVANAIVARTMTSVNPMMPMLPNQPLPPPQCQPKLMLPNQPLPQHPLPPTSATSISVVPAKTEAATPPPQPVQQPQPAPVQPQPAQPVQQPQPQQPQTAPMPPKKTAVTMAVNPKKRVIAQQLEQDQTIKMEAAQAASAAAAAPTPPAERVHTNSPSLIMIKKEMPAAPPSVQPPQQHQQQMSHMKPRDRFGREAHLKEEKKPIVQPTISLAAQEQQLALIREQEITIFFQALLKQGQNEQVALQLAQKMAQERYTAAFTLAMQQAQASVEQELRTSGQTGNTVGGVPVNPPAAHQSQSPQSPVVHVPVQAHAHSRISTSYMSHDPRDPYGPGAQHDQRHVIMSLNPPASPEPEMAISMPLNLDPLFPMVWKGFLGLKNEFASVEFRYVSGCKDLANASLPHDHPSMATLRIGQRMRLEPTHLSGVRTKMQQAAEHCVLLALPCGNDPHDMALQSRNLRSHFITYLQLKGAAGIVNVPGDPTSHFHGADQGGYVVHVFPSCDFANETMTSIAPDLLAKVAEMEHMVIIIATVLDKTQQIE